MKVSGPLNLAGAEVVGSLPATDLFQGRMVFYSGSFHVYDGSEWQELQNVSAGVLPAQDPSDAGKILQTDGTNPAWVDQYPDDTGAAGKFLTTDGAGNVSWDDPATTIPAQAGQAGKFLSTDGSSTSWDTIPRSSIDAGTADHVVVHDGSGNLSSEAALAASRGGLGADASAFTGFVKATAGAFSAAAIAAADLPTGIDAAKIADGSVDNTEFQRLNGVSGNIQTQLDGKLSLAGGTMTGSLVLAGNPTAALEPATKGYVDSVLSGLDVKGSVRAVTSADITLSGAQTIDGVSIIAGDRVLVRAQSTQADNGIYVAAAGAWSRATDFDDWTEIPGGYCFVEEGTLYADTGFVCTSNTGGTLGVTAIEFTQFSGPGSFTADGQGLEITGTQASIELDGATLSKSASGLKVADLGIGTSQLAASAVTGPKLGAITSAELAAALTNETGSGLAVFGTSPTLETPRIDDAALFEQIATPANPAAGFSKIYPKSDGFFYTLDSNGVEQQVGSGSGQGEKNYIENPSAASAITGWTAVGDLAVARSTTAAELPREYTTGTGIKITADADTQSTADYVYYDFTLDDVDLSKKLKIKWSQKTTGSYNAGDLAVVITTQADRTTALHTPVTTAIPDADGDFVTTFDSSTTATLSLVIRATTDMTTDAGIVISDVVVGPGTVEQGAAVGEWQSITFDVPSNLGAGSMTNTAYYRRVGATMELKMRSLKDGTPGSGGSIVTWSMPSGYTIDTSKVPNNLIGMGAFTGANYGSYVDVKALSTTTFCVVENGAATNLVGSDFTASSEVNFHLFLPISEWSGNGTLNIGAGAQVEYAYNSGTWDADDSTSFAYGPGGGTISGALTTTRTKRVRFQYPIQSDDLIVLEFSDGTSGWFPVGSQAAIAVQPYLVQNTAVYGARLKRVSGSTTDVDVDFGQYRFASGATFGAAGDAWAATNYWRVRKAKASSPVGFGLAKQTESGLVSNKTEWTSLTSADLTVQSNCSIDSGDVVRFKWKMTDNVLYLSMVLDTITVSNTGQSSLGFTLPSSVPRPVRTLFAPIFFYDNSGTAFKLCMAELTSAGVFTVRAPLGGTFTGGTDSCYLYGELHYALV